MGIFIIAEAGVNHNGDPALARELVNTAVAVGADAVKFQTFQADALVTDAAPKATYQEGLTNVGQSQLDMLRNLELSYDAYHMLARHCASQNIQFLSTGFDTASLAFLIDELDVTSLKIASGEITNGPLLLQAARSGKDILLSTGMSNWDDIDRSLDVLAFGYLEPAKVPTPMALTKLRCSTEGQHALASKVTILQCTTEYPTPLSEVNLLVMPAMATRFGTRVGISDHTPGTVISIAAAALGASVIEKHFTLDRKLPGPDHKASLEPDELASMITGIRSVEQALGGSEKHVTKSELANKTIVRKSLMAARPIVKGHLLTVNDIAIKRPGGGRSPMEFWSLIGTKAPHNYAKDEFF